MSDWTNCRTCGARIRFAIAPLGRLVPVERARPAFVVERVTPEGTPVLRHAEVYVGHASRCAPKRVAG